MSDYPDVYRCTSRVARKPHICFECQGAISKGERYNHHHGVWDGRGDDFRVCVDCDELREHFDQHAGHYDERVCFGGLVDAVFADNEKWDINAFIEIKKKRGATISTWMLERLNDSGDDE